MSANSKIEWTDHTFNPWRGCTKVSPGCANCYAERNAKRNPKRFGEWGPGKPRVFASDSYWSAPLRWSRAARPGFHHWRRITDRTSIGDGWTHQCTHCGSVTDKPGLFDYGGACKGIVRRPRVFCASLADWLDEEAPIEWLCRLLKLIHKTPHLDWQLLTKRPENWKERMDAAFECYLGGSFCEIKGDRDWMLPWIDAWLSGSKPSNVWVGTTVEDQIRANERIDELIKIPATVRFLSMEPLLQAVSLYPAFKVCATWPAKYGDWSEAPATEVKWARQALVPAGFNHGVHWVICGGESGPKARPMHPDWPRFIRDQCAAVGVPFLFKQWGEHAPHWHLGGEPVISQSFDPDYLRKVRQGEVLDGSLDEAMVLVGKRRAGRLLDGVEHNAFPI